MMRKALLFEFMVDNLDNAYPTVQDLVSDLDMEDIHATISPAGVIVGGALGPFSGVFYPLIIALRMTGRR